MGCKNPLDHGLTSVYIFSEAKHNRVLQFNTDSQFCKLCASNVIFIFTTFTASSGSTDYIVFLSKVVDVGSTYLANEHRITSVISKPTEASA